MTPEGRAERERRELIYRRHAEMQVIQLAIKDHRGCAPETCGGSSYDECRLASEIERLQGLYRRTGASLAEAFEREAAELVRQLDATAKISVNPADPRYRPEHPSDPSQCIGALGQCCGQEDCVIDHPVPEQYGIDLGDGGRPMVFCADCNTLAMQPHDCPGFPLVEPQHDPLSGDLIPAGQDAELEQWGRDMADELIWHPRTMKDARKGDQIRPAGSDMPNGTAVTDRYWPTAPDASDRGTWHVISAGSGKWAHKDDHVVQPGEVWLCLDGGAPRNVDPDFAIEILLTRAEIAAIELLGWDNREELR